MKHNRNKHSNKSTVMNKVLGLEKARTITFLLIFTVGVALSLICLWYVVNTNSLIEMNKKTNISARSLCIENSVIESSIEEVKNIEAVFPYDGRLSFKEIKLEIDKTTLKGEALILGCNNNVLNSLLPENSYDITNNKIVVPANFITNDKKTIKTSKLIGNELVLLIKEYNFSETESTVIAEHELPVVVSGIYNEGEIIANENQVFASNILVSKINEICNGNMYEYNEKPNETIVIVDKFENVEAVKQNLKSLNYESRVMFEFNLGFINMSIFLGLTICILVAIFSVVLFYLLLSKMININIKEFGLMKAIGFTNAKIGWYISKTILLIVAISTIIAFSITYIVAGVTGNAIFPLNFNQSFFNEFILIYFILLFTLCASVISATLIKIKRISPVIAMREVE